MITPVSPNAQVGFKSFLNITPNVTHGALPLPASSPTRTSMPPPQANAPGTSFTLTFDEERPKDVDAISLREIHALPLDVAGKIGGPPALAHAQRSIRFGYMVLIMAKEDLNAMVMEMHYPPPADPYILGKKQPDENWRIHAKLAVSSSFD